MKSISKNVQRSVFDYNKADFDSIRRELRSIDWTLMFQGNTLDYWSTFKSMLLDLELAYVPKRLVNGIAKYRKPMWITRKVAKIIKRKRIVFSLHKDKLHPAVVDINKRCKQMIKKAKIAFEY